MEEQALQEENTPVTRKEVEELMASVVRQLELRIEAASQAGAQDNQSREEALKAREETLDRREMTLKTQNALKARGLPEALAEAMDFSSEEGMAQAVDALEKAFRECVQKGVEERLKGDAPKSAPAKPLSDLSDGEYYAAISRR